ncbi:MAG: NAD(P)/FAD-dependent oxidoreductase [Pseudomonadota bacterium]
MRAALSCHDVVIVGAGLSGIAMAWHHRRARPDDDLVIAEARSSVGGTWDLFRYPGIRSDSDMATLGFTFKPWLGRKAITDGESIRHYLEATTAEHGIAERIVFGRRLVSADFVTADNRWKLTFQLETGDKEIRFSRFLMLCTGYYNYASGYLPAFPQIERFSGLVIQPQHWPQDLSLRDKRVVLIGSGATAVTLLPELAKEAAKVTMIQRTPTYIIEAPAIDRWSQRFIRWTGARAGHWLTRWKNILYTMGIFQLSRRWPTFVRRAIAKQTREQLGDTLDWRKHFTPPYNPWAQRLCVAPDGDFFEPLRTGKAEMCTGTIASFSPRHVHMASGERIDADIVVAATGLRILVAGGATLSVDGVELLPNALTTYKGAMLSGVPNLVMTLGYTNASWTLKSELICKWSVRLLNFMQRRGLQRVTPADKSAGEGQPLIDLESGYIRRAEAEMPRQTAERPWRVNQNYFLDLKAFRWSRIDDGHLQFKGEETSVSASFD